MVSLNQLPEPVAAAVRRELQSEHVRWVGRPSPRASFAAAMPIWLMGVPWSALTFTIFGVLVLAVMSDKSSGRAIEHWEYAAMGAALLFTGAFAVMGIGMLLAPFWAWWKAQHTAYAITDKRLVTVTAGVRSTAIRNVMPDQLLSFERKENRNRDGGGSLKIVTGYEKDSEGDRILLTEHLTGVADVAQAERLLQALRTSRASK